jgi:hypothetical protein
MLQENLKRLEAERSASKIFLNVKSLFITSGCINLSKQNNIGIFLCKSWKTFWNGFQRLI